MNVRWFPSKAVFLLLAFAVYSANTFPEQRIARASQSPARLQFGQLLALSDFDADGLIDEARLHGSSSQRSIRVYLSRSGKRLSFSFDGRGVDHGSLFAQDVDSDGKTDLIWTGRLRSEDVIVWLGDGAGQFERASSCEYGGGFTLGDENIASPGHSHGDAAIDSESNLSLDQPLVHECGPRLSTGLSNHLPDRVATSSPAFGEPTDRGPPLFLS